MAQEALTFPSNFLERMGHPPALGWLGHQTVPRSPSREAAGRLWLRRLVRAGEMSRRITAGELARDMGIDRRGSGPRFVKRKIGE